MFSFFIRVLYASLQLSVAINEQALFANSDVFSVVRYNSEDESVIIKMTFFMFFFQNTSN